MYLFEWSKNGQFDSMARITTLCGVSQRLLNRVIHRNCGLLSAGAKAYLSVFCKPLPGCKKV
jgi:hypothetical protein